MNGAGRSTRLREGCASGSSRGAADGGHRRDDELGKVSLSGAQAARRDFGRHCVSTRRSSAAATCCPTSDDVPTVEVGSSFADRRAPSVRRGRRGNDSLRQPGVLGAETLERLTIDGQHEQIARRASARGARTVERQQCTLADDGPGPELTRSLGSLDKDTALDDDEEPSAPLAALHEQLPGSNASLAPDLLEPAQIVGVHARSIASGRPARSVRRRRGGTRAFPSRGRARLRGLRPDRPGLRRDGRRRLVRRHVRRAGS